MCPHLVWNVRLRQMPIASWVRESDPLVATNAHVVTSCQRCGQAELTAAVSDAMRDGAP